MNKETYNNIEKLSRELSFILKDLRGNEYKDLVSISMDLGLYLEHMRHKDDKTI